MKKQDELHPAIDTVLWKWDPDLPKMETACYRGHVLIVRHAGEFDDTTQESFSMGFINGRHIGNRYNMPQICDLLFRTVDLMMERK